MTCMLLLLKDAINHRKVSSVAARCSRQDRTARLTYLLIFFHLLVKAERQILIICGTNAPIAIAAAQCIHGRSNDGIIQERGVYVRFKTPDKNRFWFLTMNAAR